MKFLRTIQVTREAGSWQGPVIYCQIYADFLRLLPYCYRNCEHPGIQFDEEFNYPYFARDITDFWKRWHISTHHLVRDYLFLPVSFTYFLES
jgi:alginate O-acetyltransferase complex protein AlgI